MKNSRLVLLIFLMLFITLSYSDQETITISVDVTGGEPGKGQVILSLFSSKENYLKRPIVKISKPPNKNGNVYFEISALMPGKYAFSAIYDQDSNGKLNTGIFGIPTEKVGFSNNAKGIVGPPTFDKASITFSASKRIHITLGAAKN